MIFNGENNVLFIALFVAFLFGMIIGYFLGMRAKHSDREIVYIASAELMTLEKKRIEMEKEPANKQLFLGNGKQALALIETYADSLKANNKIVLFSSEEINGHEITSVSDAVHSYIIDKLKEKIDIDKKGEN